MLQLQGEWTAVKTVLNGKALPNVMLASGLRTAVKNEIKVSFGGQLMIHALIQLNENENPMHVDYYNLHGSLMGTIQHGIVKWINDDVCFCMASPGKPRPGSNGHEKRPW